MSPRRREEGNSSELISPSTPSTGSIGSVSSRGFDSAGLLLLESPGLLLLLDGGFLTGPPAARAITEITGGFCHVAETFSGLANPPNAGYSLVLAKLRRSLCFRSSSNAACLLEASTEAIYSARLLSDGFEERENILLLIMW
jgi:hypothetical protein